MSGTWTGRAVYWLALTVVIAGLTHLRAVLVIPGRSEASAYTALVAAAGGTTLTTLPAGDRTRAFADPALPDAACLYDLRRGSVSVSLAIAEGDFATLSVHDRHGRVLAGLTSRSARHGRLGLTVATPSAEPARRSNETTPAGEMSDIRVEAPEPLGFVLAEVLATEPSEQAMAATTAAALSCRPADP